MSMERGVGLKIDTGKPLQTAKRGADQLNNSKGTNQPNKRRRSTALVTCIMMFRASIRICSTKDDGFRLGPVVLRSLTDGWKGGREKPEPPRYYDAVGPAVNGRSNLPPRHPHSRMRLPVDTRAVDHPIPEREAEQLCRFGPSLPVDTRGLGYPIPERTRQPPPDGCSHRISALIVILLGNFCVLKLKSDAAPCAKISLVGSVSLARHKLEWRGPWTRCCIN
ncbi:hypothetical protein B0H14DRAFT_2650042 [Mycena olivaceomarginata]|nr:hypothetical protein B0H14DRAFT_2650042 [Mycena olivaceomarginata]